MLTSLISDYLMSISRQLIKKKKVIIDLSLSKTQTEQKYQSLLTAQTLRISREFDFSIQTDSQDQHCYICFYHLIVCRWGMTPVRLPLLEHCGETPLS